MILPSTRRHMFGGMLKAIRLENRICTQMEMANHLGVTETTIQEWEDTLKYPPSDDQIIAWCEFANANATRILACLEAAQKVR